MFEDDFEKWRVQDSYWRPDDELNKFNDAELLNERSQGDSVEAQEGDNDPGAIYEAYCRSGHERWGPSPCDRLREREQKNAKP